MNSNAGLVFDRERADVNLDLTWSLLTWDALSVQRGLEGFGTGEILHQVALPQPVSTARAVTWIPSLNRQGKSQHEADDAFGEYSFTAELSGDGHTLTLARSNAADPADVAWSVVEFR